MSSPGQSPPRPVDLLAVPALGRFLRWRHSRTALQIPLFLLAALMVFDGLAGPQLAPKNLATVLTWVHYRGLVILALLLAGNLFCMACPFMLVRNLVRRWVRPLRPWPTWLRNKWLALTLFAAMLFVYEWIDLWSTPLWTAWLIVAYFAGSLLVDTLFRGASFCKYVCPLGQFNFLSSLVSPLEIQIRSAKTCRSCRTRDCIKGSPQPGIRGCELWLYQPRKVGNLDCTFCLDCIHACPHDNVGIKARMPASELWDGAALDGWRAALDGWRAGVGRLARRPDLASLVALFSFGALLNAFAMVTPVYAVEDWLAGLLGTTSEFPVLLLMFAVGLVVLPVALLAATGWISRWWSLCGPERADDVIPLSRWTVGFTYCLLPAGFGVWLAHYSFHFLTGFWTFVPVVQSFVSDLLGTPLLGAPRWHLGPLLPAAWLYPVELGFLGLGCLGSWLAAYRLAEKQVPRPRSGQVLRAFLPWAVLIALILAAAVWLMAQPMEMRGTFLMG